MITKQTLFYRAAALAFAIGLSSSAAFAQGFIKKNSDLPDSSHFYMARQQWQYVDTSPIINGQPNPPGQQQQQQQQQQGPNNQIPGVPARGLPKAGFQGYAPEQPQMSTNLPKVNNGVP